MLCKRRILRNVSWMDWNKREWIDGLEQERARRIICPLLECISVSVPSVVSAYERKVLGGSSGR
jgi:hypothetical protein